MPARRFEALLTATAAVVALAGCSTMANGTPIPAPNVTTVQSSESPRPSEPGPDNNFGAPRVAAPLDATRFLTQPCAVLTPAQLQALNLPTQGKPDTDSAVAKAAGPGCIWQSSQVRNTVGVDFMTGNKNGLADLYRAHAQGDFDGYWIETTIDGYPVVFADVSDHRSRGNCNLAVGVTDTLFIRVGESGQLKDEQKSCERAKQVASAVVRTLKGGG